MTCTAASRPIRVSRSSSWREIGSASARSADRELTPVPTSERKPLIPTSVYAITKSDHEELSLVVGGAYGIPTVALRFFNVYGPGQALSNPYTGVAAIFASRLLNGKAPIVFEDGLQSRDFVHVADIVRGILLALESDDAVGQAVNLGTGRPSTVNDIASTLADGLGVELGGRNRGKVPCGRHPSLLRRHSPGRGVAGLSRDDRPRGRDG